MTEAPERIWAWPADATGQWAKQITGLFSFAKPATKPCVEYVRADKVQALVEALQSAQESIATFMGVHEYPKDSGAGMVLDEVSAALDAFTEAQEKRK